MRAGNILIAALLVCLFCASARSADQIPNLSWEKRSDWKDVKEHGVIGDGVADDAPAIQSLLDKIDSGDCIYFPPGSYRVTTTLFMRGPKLGCSLIGHGNMARIIWDGEPDGSILREDGFAQNARYEGFVFDGAGKAGIGFWHWNNTRFETELLHRNMAFTGFRKAGIFMEPTGKDSAKFASAEILFQNCLFESCENGVQFSSFNDYNYTFDACEFRRCGRGISCVRGNFYVRNCHFESSRVADIQSHAEHACSVRRSTSFKSKSFIINSSSVAPFIVEDCHVSSWGPGAPDGFGEEGAAIVQKGLSMLIFDSSFSSPPDERAPVFAAGFVIQSNCGHPHRAELCGALRGKSPADIAFEQKTLKANVLKLPPGDRAKSSLNSQTSFLSANWTTPSKIFDAKRDFGAKGDGKADDGDAIRAAIDAARQHGQNAMAYLPKGNYLISKRLLLDGSNYIFGGSGPFSRILWRGSEEEASIEIFNPDRLKIENLMVGHHDSGPAKNIADILVRDDKASSLNIEAVFVFGMYQKKPFERGILFQKLSKGTLVVLDRVNGNMRFSDCARATVFAPVSYEGSILIEGKNPDRDGFMGFQTRLCTIAEGALYLRDNHSIVMSDFYIEQCDSALHFSGTDALPQGRASIQSPKMHLSEKLREPPPLIDIDNYSGEIVLGPSQFPCWPVPAAFSQQGASPLLLVLFGSKFYESFPEWKISGSARLALLANKSFGPYDRITKNAALISLASQKGKLDDSASEKDIEAILRAFSDYRRLGALDLEIKQTAFFNH